MDDEQAKIASSVDVVDVVDESVDDDIGLHETEPSALPYFGADFDVAGLVRRLIDGDILIPRFDPDEASGLSIQGFQRQQVWTAAQMDRFIESLLLGWPIPSIFLVQEPDGRYLVLDGQQRLTTLQSFYSGLRPDGKEFALKEVDQKFQTFTYASLSSESRRRLNNTFIQAVIIEPDGDEGRDAVYRLFGRLNSGGVSLTAQEIRVALYRGPLVDFIRDLNHDSNWRTLFGAVHKKLKDHELVLRALAMAQVLDSINGRWEEPAVQAAAYKPPMAQFLNSYLESNREMAPASLEKIGAAFHSACMLLVEAHGRDGLKLAGRINAAHVDAVLGVMIYSLLNGLDLTALRVRTAVERLRKSPEYGDWVSRSTSHRDSVMGRLRTAQSAFELG